MKKLILTSVLALTTLSVFSQRKYDFDVPLRAKSNEGVYEWFIEHLDETSGSLVNQIFKSIGVNTDNIQWMFPTDLLHVCHKNGWDFYSENQYIVNTKDKNIKTIKVNESENKLNHSLFHLSYIHKDGITTLYLTEYY
jgi:hypothetical protein